MNAAGIVCEYNPFHSGHKYHIEATRRLLGEDAGIVCVMSGNFVQRGDCAAFSKHARARAAISGGADLVLELPVPWVLSSAESFARGGMWILERLGIVTHLSFGSECGDIGTLKAAAEGSDSSEGNISELMASGISYAAARERALSEVDPTLGAVLSSPNNILGVEYLKAIRRLGSKIEPVTVPRHMAGHDGDIPVEGFASASYIRKNMDEIARFVPESCTDILNPSLTAGERPQALITASGRYWEGSAPWARRSTTASPSEARGSPTVL
jgi:predicted nucleotidyltransferase